MRALAVVVTLCGAGPAVAQGLGLGPIPGEERFAAMQGAEEAKGKAGAGLGFAQLDEDYYLQLNIGSEFSFGPFGFGVLVPLNLLVSDQDPKNPDASTLSVREEDWDETSDYLKVLRYVRYGHKRDTIYLRVGELAAEMGHGTIMSRYMNNTDINTFRVGSQFDVNTVYGGFETLVNDVAALGSETSDSRIAGGRVYLKPYGFVDSEGTGLLNSFAIGFTMISDLNAPTEFALDDAGQRVVNDKNNYKVTDDETVSVTGIDVEVQVLDLPILDVIPYLDFNMIQDAGEGLHVGVMSTFTLPIGFELSIPTRIEYRRFDANYVPVYYGTFYEQERFAPKHELLKLIDEDDPALNGWYAEAAFGFAGMLQLGAIYEDYENVDPNFVAFLSVPALEVIQFKAFYTRLAVTGWNDVFKLDERSLLIAQARYQVYPFVYLVGRFTRRWQLDETTRQYESVDDWNAGLEVSFEF